MVPDITNAVPDIVNAVPDIVNAVPDIVNVVPDIANAVADIANAVPAEIRSQVNTLLNIWVWGTNRRGAEGAERD
ncbi:MAG: hypothetical protein V7L00_07050 [Nostoc sp.]|uniref:hypothetical protein n=1 Tax=unclassified Nostoc TaxID=2593658 RepID=UPI0025FAB5F9|nr:hypothetical protein [Nostoc sp. JL33]MBN3871903.1 hypothetical protein [Nostoc sp. JL33]